MLIYTACRYGLRYEALRAVAGVRLFDPSKFVEYAARDDLFPVVMARPRYGPKLEAAYACLLYTSPSPRDSDSSRMPSSA